ncbi:MAG: phosphatase PAP2 family protein [Phycisphaerales bacterium]|nr:phosphatase PAP2 family protein [Phycisphaerales bacterium]
MLLGGVVFAVLYPLDGLLQPLLHVQNLGGDVRRSLETLQQFGDLSTLILVALVIWLLDPPRRTRLVDLFLAALVVVLMCNLLKMGLGRPRPILLDPWSLVLPWQTYPLPQTVDGNAITVDTHAWQLGHGGLSRLWSMPSSHTAAAVTLAVFLNHYYPRLKPLLIGLVVIVGSARVILGAHYPSDVVAGAMLAYPVASTIMNRKTVTQLILK